MAYVRKLANGKWRAEVQKEGHRQSAVWETKQQANEWAKKKEALLLVEVKKKEVHTFEEAVTRYVTSVSVDKAGHRLENIRLKRLLNEFGKTKPIAEITKVDIANWRDKRLNAQVKHLGVWRKISPSSVLRDITLIKHLFKVAKDEWGWVEQDPFTGVRMPKSSPPRHERWHWHEIKRVVRFLGYVANEVPQTKYQKTALAFMISLRTALRQQEVLQVSTRSIKGRVLVLERTKTERRAEVPLTKQGFKLCQLAPADWSMTPDLLSALFRKARDAVLLNHLTFHDARATALTFLARKVDVLTLSKISRHKNLSLLSNVYYRESAAEIANRL